MFKNIIRGYLKLIKYIIIIYKYESIQIILIQVAGYRISNINTKYRRLTNHLRSQ